MGVLKQKRLHAAKSTSADLTCRETVDAMGDFVSETISPAHRLQFEEHLKACGECAVFLRTYKKAVEAMRTALKSHLRPTPVFKLRKPPREHYRLKLADDRLN